VIIAIDGPAASGKGTLGRRLAKRYGLCYLDTGSLYRKVGYLLLAAGKSPDDEAAAVAAARQLATADVPDRELRSEQIGRAASIVAAIPAVRVAILDYQRAFARASRGAVLDGRDIGTVVLPDADFKFFITADAEVRAARRSEQLRRAGEAPDPAAIIADLRERDRRDRERATAPLTKADDAHLLDTTNLDIEAAFTAATSVIDKAQAD